MSSCSGRIRARLGLLLSEALLLMLLLDVLCKKTRRNLYIQLQENYYVHVGINAACTEGTCVAIEWVAQETYASWDRHPWVAQENVRSATLKVNRRWHLVVLSPNP
ncbi:hypothetical protein EV2_025269 [Malus domestica]